ncbi:MAG: hypothetical protein KGS72_22500 [Cyanobacteria bacterium REEB67]|nr:hypothetical protein [Cyanobacteria bacterium REEB67]
MANHVKVGDVLEVVFARASRGVQTLELINGRRAFAVDSGDAPLPGDRWSVMVVGMNRTRTVYFVEPLNIVETTDGLGKLLSAYSPVYHEHIRTTEAQLAALLSRTAGDDEDLGEEAANEEDAGERIVWINPDCSPEERAEAEEFLAEFAPSLEEEVALILDNAFLPEAYVADCMGRFAAH